MEDRLACTGVYTLAWVDHVTKAELSSQAVLYHSVFPQIFMGLTLPRGSAPPPPPPTPPTLAIIHRGA